VQVASCARPSTLSLTLPVKGILMMSWKRPRRSCQGQGHDVATGEKGASGSTLRAEARRSAVYLQSAPRNTLLASGVLPEGLFCPDRASGSTFLAHSPGQKHFSRRAVPPAAHSSRRNLNVPPGGTHLPSDFSRLTVLPKAPFRRSAPASTLLTCSSASLSSHFAVSYRSLYGLIACSAVCPGEREEQHEEGRENR